MSKPLPLTVEQQALVEGARAGMKRLAGSVARRYRAGSEDDLAQLGMLKAVELVGAYDPTAGASFETFIFRTARRVMVAACHVERRERAVTEGAARRARAHHGLLDVYGEHEGGESCASEREVLAASAVVEMQGTPDTPEHLLVRAQERTRLAERVDVALARLTTTDRALVRACACDGTSVAVAARDVGLDYHKAHYALKLAMASLGKWLRTAA